MKTDLVSPHLSLNVRGPSTKLTPDKHNFLFQNFAITATRPSTHSWEGNGGRETDIANKLSKRNPAIFNRGPRFPRQSEHRRLFGEEFSLPFSFKLAEAVSR